MFNKILEEIGITDRCYGYAKLKDSLRTAIKLNMKVYSNYDDAFRISLLQLYGGFNMNNLKIILAEAEEVYNEMKPEEASNDL